MPLNAAYPRFTLGDTLSPAQTAFFAEHGFLHFTGFIDRATIAELVAASEAVQRRWLAERRAKVNGIPVKYGRDLDGRPIVQRFAFANQHHPRLAAFLADPRFAVLFPLIGRDGARMGGDEKDGLVLNHYVHGEGSQHSRLGWHTDGLRDLFLGKRQLHPLLNVGVHLDDLGPEHGGLRLIPGTHRQGLLRMAFGKRYFVDHRPDPREIAVIPAAGDLTVHDGRLWHRVQQSAVRGEASRRRVFYLPVVAGPYEPKHEASPTPIYHRLASWRGWNPKPPTALPDTGA